MDLSNNENNGEIILKEPIYFGNNDLEEEIKSETFNNDASNNYVFGVSTWREMPISTISEILNIPIAEPQELTENVKNYLDDFVDGSKDFNPDRFDNFPKEWFEYIKEATEQQIKIINDTKLVKRKEGKFNISFK